MGDKRGVPFAWILNFLFREKLIRDNLTHGVNKKAKAKARQHRKTVKKQKRAA